MSTWLMCFGHGSLVGSCENKVNLRVMLKPGNFLFRSMTGVEDRPILTHILLAIREYIIEQFIANLSIFLTSCDVY
jgi:hypothetical protein